MKITSGEIIDLAQYIKDISGINLDQTKSYLFESRLKNIIVDAGCSSFSELCHKAKTDASKSLERKIIDAITTNETLFFRDVSPFELLQHKVLPDLIDLRTAESSGDLPIPINIWSAACSTGQEVYSISIVIKEILPDLTKYNIKLLGTDISDTAVSRASYGAYNKFEIERGLSRDKLNRYFTSNGDRWKVNDEVRSIATFKKQNLMQPFASLGKFDIVFCRNVAIYFSLEDRKALFEKIAGLLATDGYLVIGSTESLAGVCSLFEPKRYLRSIFYQLKNKI